MTDYKLFRGPQQTTSKKYPQVSGIPQNTASDTFYYPQKLAGIPNSIQQDTFAMPENYYGRGAAELPTFEPKQSYHLSKEVNYYQGLTEDYPQAPEVYQQTHFQGGYQTRGQDGVYKDNGGYAGDGAYLPNGGAQYPEADHQWEDWGHEGRFNKFDNFGQENYHRGHQKDAHQDYWPQTNHNHGPQFAYAQRQGQTHGRKQQNKQAQHYTNFGNPNQQTYKRNDQQTGNRYSNNRKHDNKDYMNNLNFNYRLKADGQLFSMSQLPVQATYTKNLIPDISAFSRSEPSIEERRRKKSFSDSDLVAELSDRHSEDIENSRRKRQMKGRFLNRTKSNDDLEFSDLANIKIEGLIQRKFGFKSQEKKSYTVTDKQSKQNSETYARKSESKDKKPGFHKLATDSMQIEGPTPDRKAEKKIPAKVEKPKNEKHKPEKGKKVEEIAKANQKKNKDEDVVDGDKIKYNREKVVAIFEDMINTGRFDQSKVKTIEKFDLELGKIVKFVRIEMSRPTINNDHFISLKPDNVQNRHQPEGDINQRYKDHEGKRNYGYNQEKRERQLDQGLQSLPNTNFQIQNQQIKFADVNMPASLQQEDQVALDESQMTIVEQAKHKTMTGKLQRNIRKMNDEEKISLFKQLKSNLHELATNLFGRYVLVLLLKTNITAIVDALISYFDKKVMELIIDKNGLLLSQSLIDLKFKDVRLRRSLKRIDSNLKELMADENAPSVILIYANQLPSSDMEDFVEYCKIDYHICLGNSQACKIFAKVYSKVSDVDRLEIELNLKTIMPQIFDGNYGKELVEVFFMKADPQNLLPLRKKLFEKLEIYLTSEEYDYFFLKVVELKKTDLIDAVMTHLFKDGSWSDIRVMEILNHETGYKVILSFFTLASLGAKDLMREKLNEIRKNQGGTFNSYGKKVLCLCDSYFSAPSK
jgi:hypothetical protein